VTIEFSLPDIGEGLDEAEVIEWHVKPGDKIARDQPFVDILTDKAQTEMPAPGAGTVVSLGAAVGDVVKVGDVLIVIDDGQGSDDSPSSTHEPEASLLTASTISAPQPPTPPATALPPAPSHRPTPAPAPAPTRAPAPSHQAPPTPARRPKASPSTRKLAAELGVDLTAVNGSGPGGRILATDVTNTATAATTPATMVGGQAGAAAAGAAAVHSDAAADALRSEPVMPSGPAPLLGQMPIGTHPIRGIRRATAKAMDLSWSTIPHVTAMDELDATELLLARSRAREALGERGAVVTPLALLLVAVARGLRRFPMMNATLDLADDRITIHEEVNVGVAVASERGLLVPIVRNADRLGVAAMAEEVARLSAEARSGSISPADLTGGTFTVSNYGSNGGYFAAPIIRPGEAGIVGFGSITKRPIVVDDQVEARPVIPVVLSADHRLIDGDVLSAFQADLSGSIQKAITLLVS
jgi:pyruvate/2-oxoglutarate dehydrogenase complex dihydrolipoamide acyltransferase (E2) component